MLPDTSKQKQKKPESRLQTAGSYILLYLVFIVFLVMAAFLLFRVRMNVIQIGFLLGYNQVQVKGFSNLGVLISGVLILAGIVFAEDYLRKGVQEGLMWKRILRVFILEAGVILLSLLSYYLIILFTT